MHLNYFSCIIKTVQTGFDYEDIINAVIIYLEITDNTNDAVNINL